MSSFKTGRSEKKNVLALAMALFCVIVWGGSYAVIRSAVQQFAPLTLACLRFYIAALLLWLLTRNRRVRMQSGDRKAIIKLTFSGIVFYFACENMGLKLTTASHGSLIIATIPLGTELVWAWYHRSRPTWRTCLGTIAAISGVGLLVGSDAGDASLAGDMLMFGAVGCWIIYTFQVNNISGRYPPLVMTFWMMMIGAVSFTPGALVELWVYGLPRPDFLAWEQLLFLAIVCSALGYDFWNRAVPALGPTTINSLLYFIPLVGVASGIVFLDEPITYSLFFGGGMIFLGVILSHRN